MSEACNTKHELAAAFKTLLCQKAFGKISVEEICSQCKLNRKSFYYHFRDKYDLVIWIFETEFMSVLDRDRLHSEWDFILTLCGYFEANRMYYRRVMAVDGQNSLEEYIRALVQPALTQLMPSLCSDNIRFAFYVHFYSDAFIASLRRWLNDQPDLSAQEFVDLLRSCMSFPAESSSNK